MAGPDRTPQDTRHHPSAGTQQATRRDPLPGSYEPPAYRAPHDASPDAAEDRAIRSRVLSEGVTAGLVGAVVIAVYFAVLDAIRGDMFATPILLGSALASLFLDPATIPSPAAAFVLYTLFHFAAFVLVGLIFAWVANAAERTPSALIGFAGLFVAFEIGWIGFTQMLAKSGLGELSWLQVGAANLIAAAVMGYVIFRRHPGLGRRVDAVLAGGPE